MTTSQPATGSAEPFGVLRVATAHDQPSDLYPEPGTGRDAIALSADDGGTSWFRHRHQGRRRHRGAPRTIAQIPELRATLHVTQARVAVASTRYDIGRGWRGTAVGALLATAADGALDESGSNAWCPMLVGHLRLAWLVSVHARLRPSLVSQHTLAIGYRDPTTHGFGSLTLTLDRRGPARGGSHVSSRWLPHMPRPGPRASNRTCGPALPRSRGHRPPRRRERWWPICSRNHRARSPCAA